MKTFVCDVCGLSVGEYRLNTLYEEFKINGIEHICDDCNKELGTIKSRIEEAIKPIKNSWIKQVILKMKGGKK